MATEEQDNHHIKNEPSKMDALAGALRTTQAAREEKEVEMKKRLEQRINQAVEDYIKHLDLSEHVTAAALKGLQEACINLKPPYKFFEHNDHLQPFLTEHSPEMDLKFQKSWTDFFHLLNRTIRSGPFKSSELRLPAFIDGTIDNDLWNGAVWDGKRANNVDTLWVQSFCNAGLDYKKRLQPIPHIFVPREGNLSICSCGLQGKSAVHSQDAIWPSKLILKWSSGQ